MIYSTDQRIIESSAVTNGLCSTQSQKKRKKKKKKMVQLWTEGGRDLEINGVQKLHVLYLS